jgi:AMP-binding enzyme
VDAVRWHADRTPDRVHLHLRNEDGTERPITYGEMVAASTALGGALRTRGVARGERVALMLRIERAFFETFLGTLLIGAVPASAPLVNELAGVMAEEKMEAIAAGDPAEPDRFVAALLFPGVQLLVVSARYSAPALLAEQLERKGYRDIYAALHGAPIAETKFFVQDMGVDGLHLEPGASVDVVYQRNVEQTMFDGHPEQHGMSKAAYAEKFEQADERYSHLLRLLIDQAAPR